MEVLAMSYSKGSLQDPIGRNQKGSSRSELHTTKITRTAGVKSVFFSGERAPECPHQSSFSEGSTEREQQGTRKWAHFQQWMSCSACSLLIFGLNWRALTCSTQWPDFRRKAKPTPKFFSPTHLTHGPYYMTISPLLVPLFSLSLQVLFGVVLGFYYLYLSHVWIWWKLCLLILPLPLRTIHKSRVSGKRGSQNPW